jgi:hypothetical protein
MSFYKRHTDEPDTERPWKYRVWVNGEIDWEASFASEFENMDEESLRNVTVAWDFPRGGYKPMDKRRHSTRVKGDYVHCIKSMKEALFSSRAHSPPSFDSKAEGQRIRTLQDPDKEYIERPLWGVPPRENTDQAREFQNDLGRMNGDHLYRRSSWGPYPTTKRGAL